MRTFLMAAALRGAAALAKLPLERFSVAPMMDYTDRHFRHLFRLLSKESVLYTEMVTANTLVDDHGSPRHGSGDRWLCLLYTSPSPRDQRGSRMPSSA